MKRTVFAHAMILTALSVLLGSCGTDDRTTVVFWNGYTGPDRPVLERLVDDFNNSQDEIRIHMEIMPWDTLFQRLMPALIAGNAPDIIAMGVDRFSEYAQANRLEALDGYLANSTSLSMENLTQGLMQAGRFNGSQYGMPMSVAAMVMYYNKGLFREAGLNPENPPSTLAELQAVWPALTRRDSGGQVTQYAQAIAVRHTVPMIPVFMWMHGADVLSNGASSLDSPQMLAAMTMLANAFRDGVSPQGLTGQEADNLFAAGRAAIEFNGPWAITGFRNAGIDLGIAPVPVGPAGRATWGGDSLLVMNRDSKVKAAAWSFIEYWNSVEVQRTWALDVGFPPSRADMSNDTTLLQGNPDISVFLESLPYIKIFLAGEPKAGRITDEILTPLFESVLRGQETPESGLATAHRRLNSLMAE